MTAPDLSRLLRPRSIAVVGANDRPGSYASEALLNLAAIGYRGEVWGVNPGRTSVFGHPCVPSVSELPESVDAVVVAIPAAGVPEVIEQAGTRGCGGAVVISAGFAEVAAGVELQQQLVAAAEPHALPVCGPNCNGIVGMHARVALWGDALIPREPGAVALVSQSGNVAVNALATRRGLRFHTVIASGNQAVVSAADYLSFLAHEPGLGSVALYLEDDGDPTLCEALAQCLETGVRVAVLKVGRSDAGARAAAAHSAALAGDQRVFRSLLEEAGAVWAADVHELLELAKALAVPTRRKRIGGRGLAIMTCSGGDSAQGADEAVRLGLELPELAPATRERLASILPPAATVANPIDYTAMIWGDKPALAELVATVGNDPAVDDVLIFYDQPPGIGGAAQESWRAVREGITAGAVSSPAPAIVSSTLPELLDDEAAVRFIAAGIPAVAGLRTGVACAAALGLTAPDPQRLRAIGEHAGAAAALAATGAAPGHESEWLAEHQAKALLRAAGIEVVPGRLVADEQDAGRALTELGAPLVLKLSGAGIQHKSELGGVILNLTGEAEVRAAYRRLAPLAEAHQANVLAEAMAGPGVELVIAATSAGVVPALVLGLGGIWTELFDDVAVVPLPAGESRLERALRSLRGAPLLLGRRGGVPCDVSAAARLAARVGELLVEASLDLIECNPVLVGAAGAVALDATARRMMPVRSVVGTAPVEGWAA